MGYQALAPVTEGCSGLALPVDGFDEVAQLVRSLVDGSPCRQECLTRVFKMLRVGVLDQVDHRVEVEALERSPSRGAPRASEGEQVHDVLDLPVDVSGDQLVLDALLVLRLLFLGCQFRLLVVAHQLSPKSS
ncbi:MULTISPECIES: hypothetical protein [unclassified Streptomyces]|uniref:hypothetical protein n=1 Tax=unclassified Streptomyces TaxID=2593676 RepID=UPI002B1E4339|nr:MULTISPECIES: hypothetical protein [unclassified Streptomyces]